MLSIVDNFGCAKALVFFCGMVKLAKVRVPAGC